MTKLLALAVSLGLVALGCGGDDTCDDCGPSGTQAVFALDADLASPDHFFDAPYPSDLRLDADGHPVLTGFPNPKSLAFAQGLVDNAAEARGFPVIPVAHFRFTAPLAPRTLDETLPADATSAILLVDVDPDSPEHGRLLPVVAQTLEPDLYAPSWLLSVAPRPGFVLRPDTTYAFVVRAAAKDATGVELVQEPAIARLVARAPQGAAEAAADLVYAPLWDELAGLGIDAASVVAAAVFTTSDVVREQAELSDALLAVHSPAIADLAAYDDAGVTDLCIVSGTIAMPQFQTGTPPFDTEGRFEFGAGGLPVVQRTDTVPVKLVLPKTTMPDAGYPLVLNIHGSGGFSIAMVRPVGDDGLPGMPIGPAFPYASRGFAMAGMAMPVNPERLPGAEEIAYLNPNNLGAMRDTFRQGQIELRLFIAALQQVQIDPAALGTCTGPALPNGQTTFHFDTSRFIVTGQSMGGMYTNMIAATEPAVQAAVPTGAGGHWTHFIFHTPLSGGAFPGLIKVLLQTQAPLSFVHPVLAIGAAALEAADAIVYMPRVARRPLPGHPARPIYEPVGPQDSYFAQETYDAVVLAYGHPEAGTPQWSSMQDALALAGLDGLLSFPLEDNLTSENGQAYTGFVVQYAPVGLPGEAGPPDGHAIYSHREDVKYQYACFAESFFATGHARVPPPVEDWAAPCQ